MPGRQGFTTHLPRRLPSPPPLPAQYMLSLQSQLQALTEGGGNAECPSLAPGVTTTSPHDRALMDVDVQKVSLLQQYMPPDTTAVAQGGLQLPQSAVGKGGLGGRGVERNAVQRGDHHAPHEVGGGWSDDSPASGVTNQSAAPIHSNVSVRPMAAAPDLPTPINMGSGKGERQGERQAGLGSGSHGDDTTMRDDLFRGRNESHGAPQASSTGGVGTGTGDAGSALSRQLDDEHATRDRMSEDMISMATQLRHRHEAMQDNLKRDNARLDDNVETAAENVDTTKSTTGKVTTLNSSSWSWTFTVWGLLILVVAMFVVMVMFMRLVPKR